ncbi:MAG: DNA polymerase I [bacterium]|nr:DNA polymerase I [bacterium]
MSRPMFYLIDGHAVAYRQFFGLPLESFSTSAGEPTNAVYGFTRILLDILQKERPKYLAVSFDMGMSGRENLYAEYKGTREKMRPELESQLPRIMEVVRAFNIPILAQENYEADDVIGTAVKIVQDQDVDTRVITGDRDILQLLTEYVTVQLPPSRQGGVDEVWDIARFRERYGFEPPQLVDYKALVGDNSDNIPGVAGIGEKTATSLLQAYSSLDGIYEHINEIKGATQKKLIEGRESAYLSRRLAAILRDVPIDLDLPKCVAHDFEPNGLLDLFDALEFRSFKERVLKLTTPQQTSLFGEATFSASDSDDEDFDDGMDDFAPRPKAEWLVETTIVRDEAGLQALVESLNTASGIVFDTETTSTDQMSGDLVGIALATNGEAAWYIPVGHREGKQLPLQQVLDAIRPALTNPAVPKYAHNAAYDVVVMQRYGIEVAPIGFDTMIAEWLIDPESKFLGLKNFAMQYLKIQMTNITDLIGTGKAQKTMDDVAIDLAAPYAAADSAVTYRAVEYLQPRVEREGLMELYQTLEMPLVPVIAAMEQVGIVLDIAYLGQVSGMLTERLSALEQEIFALSEGFGQFNINSPKQLNDVLFVKLKLPVKGIKKTSHGYSTDAATLEALRDEHEIVRKILEYRELTKLKGTYVDALPTLVNPHTGRVHTSYNQTGTSTGRISSSNPNLQNIPIRTEIGREVRRAFIAPPGKKLLSVDYSQIELRVMAHISQDQTLLNAFAQGQDIHAATAAAVYGVPLEQVTYEQRSFAKRVNFGLMYGMGAHRLARDSNLTYAEAEAFIKTYFERLPKVQVYIEETRRKAAQPEGLTTLFGRRRHFRSLTNPHAGRQEREAELRAAINMPIQGTAADIMKRAMIDLYNELQQSRLNAMMTLQVHDELVLEVPEDEVVPTSELVVRVMENACELDAPLRANAQVGQNWREMQPVQK